MEDQPLERTKAEERQAHRAFPVVGLGASAGGLEALYQLLSELPSDTGMAFIVVQHLDPRHESSLPALLARATSLTVREAAHGLSVEPNEVYVISPNTKLGMVRGALQVTPRDEGRGPHLPIDYLFRSLADDQQGRAVAVVLSGTGSDGTQGLCEVKAVGGITFAQDERTAAHPGMPHSAMESGCVDFVMSPEAIARRLAEIGRHPYLVTPDGSHAAPDGAGDENYQNILEAVRASQGVDFSLYRDTTIKRRIMRRMALHTHQSIADYAQRVQTDAGEAEALYHDLLVNVTSFFRDPSMFDALKSTILPALMHDRPAGHPLRLWVAGCSTGQEAYSLAMTVFEFFDSAPARPTLQIFATDLSDQMSLDKARAGIYPEAIEAEIAPERLRRFFRREDHGYRIDKSIRDVCVFARHNVTSDPPFSHVDLISCRNLLIYLTTPLQKRILPTLHYALNVPGYLVLGTAETVGEHTDLFELTDRTNRIYAKKPMPFRRVALFPASDHRTAAGAGRRRTSVATQPAAEFQKEADRILLGRYAPPAVLVDENFDILQFRGRTSPYLEPPAGEPTVNVLKMAREGLLLELRAALTEAKKDKRTVRREGILLRTDGETREMALEIVPVSAQADGSCYLILFKAPSLEARSAADDASRDVPPLSESEATRDVAHLRQELAATREYLQSMIEQQDAANEELRSANEEILSSNEELQSTNEELETAKEELQSTNEELTTVNEQLHRRNQEVDQVNNDLTNLLASTTIPVVMIGGDLRIRRFTPPARKIMNLLPSDVGRPITDIKPTIRLEDLGALVGEVMDRVQPSEREVCDAEGRWFLLRVHPYRTADNRIDGAVLVLLDIDDMRRAEEEQRRMKALIDLSQDAIIVRDIDDRIVSWNRGAEEMFGWRLEEVKGQVMASVLPTEPNVVIQAKDRLARDGTWEGEIHQVRRDGTPITVHRREVLTRDATGTVSAVLAIHHDITERLRTLDRLRQADRRKDEFLATLAHELRNPLGPIRNAIEIMRLSGDDPAAILRIRDLLDRQVRQLARIVDDLIDVARIAEGKIELRKGRIQLATVVETALETCRSLIERYRHRLRVTIPDETLFLEGDSARLSQILINLLNNAAKCTEAGGEISLEAERASGASGGSDVVLRVRDNGIGIAPDLLPRVFDIFTQGRRVTGNEPNGLGIGLTLVRSLVQMHGGTVEVQSAGEGAGTEFTVRLPIVRDGPVVSVAAPPASVPFVRRRVLVVDDNPDQVESLGMLLELMGHEVTVADSGAGALVALETFLPDVALIDIGLPGMNGYEVARQVREQDRFRGVFLVAQTGWGQTEDRRRSRAAGFDRHLIKPVAREALEQLLTNLAAAR